MVSGDQQSAGADWQKRSLRPRPRHASGRAYGSADFYKDRSRLPIISGGHRLPATSCIAEEFINLARVGTMGRSGCHLFSEYPWPRAQKSGLPFIPTFIPMRDEPEHPLSGVADLLSCFGASGAKPAAGWVWVCTHKPYSSSRSGMGKWKTCFRFSTFPSRFACAVGMWKFRRLLARFPRGGGKSGKPGFGFPRFPPPRHFHSAFSATTAAAGQ
jgi:hypothetical protein